MGKKNLFSFLVANLSLAERDGLFISISFLEGFIAFLIYFSNKTEFSSIASGRYLEGFDLFLEKLLKKYFTILSSIE